MNEGKDHWFFPFPYDEYLNYTNLGGLLMNLDYIERILYNYFLNNDSHFKSITDDPLIMNEVSEKGYIVYNNAQSNAATQISKGMLHKTLLDLMENKLIAADELAYNDDQINIIF